MSTSLHKNLLLDGFLLFLSLGIHIVVIKDYLGEDTISDSYVLGHILLQAIEYTKCPACVHYFVI
ncbi:unnamed protein product [Protopolystoma xenopodis]|uniref:Uncharacterized protein n=1 Tax=Protopolystoma xenopodis TaxID=117903 RepID=A0A3S5BVV9_9PLAT|nr:unnamed protein product [Protopolystoma xenopodis]